MRTVRYYLEEGLIVAAGRSAGGFYLFDAPAADKVRFIRELADLGFPLARIKLVLQCRQRLANGETGHQRLVDELQDQLERTRRRLEDFHRLEDELVTTIGLLETCARQACTPARDKCPACDLFKQAGGRLLPFEALL